MPIITIYAVIAATVFGSGYGACWSHMTKQIATLEAQIDLSNTEAATVLRNSTIAAKQSESDAQVAAVQLQDAHDKSLKLTTDLHHSLLAIRMRDPGQRSDCTNPLPENSHTPGITPAADTGDLSTAASGFLRSEAYRADTLAIYASECHQFVVSNCGIKQ
jgi:hypothetical protein